jgi:Sec-independent protein secretion pathway component TatC
MSLEHSMSCARLVIAPRWASAAWCRSPSSSASTVMRPLAEMLPKGSSPGLVYTEPTEAFVLYLKIALLAGIILALPVVLWQVWLFIAPGLYAKEKRLAIPFIVLATIGFVGGAAFSHYLLFRWTWSSGQLRAARYCRSCRNRISLRSA